jgi:hypothetical protein
VQVFFTLFFFLAALASVPAFLELWLGRAAGEGCEKSSQGELRHVRSGDCGREGGSEGGGRLDMARTGSLNPRPNRDPLLLTQRLLSCLQCGPQI